MSGINRVQGSGVNFENTDNITTQPANQEVKTTTDTSVASVAPLAGARVNQAAIKDGVAASKFETHKTTSSSKGITGFQKSASWTKSKDLAGKVGPENFPEAPFGTLGGLPLGGSQPNVAMAGLDVSKEAAGGVVYATGKVIAGPSYNTTVNADLKNYGAIIGAQGQIGINAAGEAGYQRNLGQVLGQQVGVNVRVNANGFAGVEGAAKAELSFKGGPKVQVGGEVFAGARARLQGTTGLRVNNSEVGEVHAGVEGWAGVGLKGDIDISFKNGKLDFDVEAGAALGLGGSVDVGGSINFLGLIRAYQNSVVGQAVSKTISAVADTAQSVAKTVVNKVQQAGESVKNWVKSIF